MDSSLWEYGACDRCDRLSHVLSGQLSGSIADSLDGSSIGPQHDSSENQSIRSLSIGQPDSKAPRDSPRDTDSPIIIASVIPRPVPTLPSVAESASSPMPTRSLAEPPPPVRAGKKGSGKFGLFSSSKSRQRKAVCSRYRFTDALINLPQPISTKDISGPQAFEHVLHFDKDVCQGT